MKTIVTADCPSCAEWAKSVPCPTCFVGVGVACNHYLASLRVHTARVDASEHAAAVELLEHARAAADGGESDIRALDWKGIDAFLEREAHRQRH
jgi:hypothetical protein